MGGGARRVAAATAHRAFDGLGARPRKRHTLGTNAARRCKHIRRDALTLNIRGPEGPWVKRMEAAMLREQMINVLETAVVVLALTNAISVAAAAYAISLAHGGGRADGRPVAQPALLGLLTRRRRVTG